MKELQALLFDVDGTLAETERDAHRVAFNETFAEYKLDWNWSIKLYGKLLAVTGGKERMKFFLDKYRPGYKQLNDAHDFIIELHKNKTKRYNNMLRDNPLVLRPGVRRLLEEARNEGVRLGIATTTTPENVTSLLEHSLAPDAVSWFEVIAAGSMAKAKKPAPDIYNYALQQMNLQADQCIAIEDSQNGIRSAQAAGIPTLITVSNYTRNEDFSGAMLVLDNLGEPNQPLTVLKGDVGDATYVNINLLKNCLNR
ncbi:HAD family hydrolase [Candidatus Halobeggiatoa sp. HSG11]|nr:HAD family hydrolase [Candidatus Halobeggiatoa sp. HSG11]